MARRALASQVDGIAAAWKTAFSGIQKAYLNLPVGLLTLSSGRTLSKGSRAAGNAGVSALLDTLTS